MAELLVRVIDKVNTDFYLNCQCTKRGDVIVVQEDGWPWGKDELTLPFWRIFRLPNVSVSVASALVTPEIASGPTPSRTLQKRGFKLDLNNALIPAALAAYIADDTRAAPTFISTLSVTTFNLLKVQKAPIVDPAIIGSAPQVIG